MLITAQACGCIALPEIAAEITVGPGAVFDVTQDGGERLVLTRVPSPVVPGDLSACAACPVL